MKIIWVDDKINSLPYAVSTLRVAGHHVKTFDGVSEFLNWFVKAKESSVHIFFLDLIMSVEWKDRERLEDIGCSEVSSRDSEAGILMYNAIRTRFPNKPVVFLTVIPSDLKANKLLNEDKNLRVVSNDEGISSVLEIALEMMEEE
ncbi:MAG: hypothetical protein GY845_16135 [Planctomycetes bacterium]|nr:hypothetical protein [Planctomycetota bacterium]